MLHISKYGLILVVPALLLSVLFSYIFTSGATGSLGTGETQTWRVVHENTNKDNEEFRISYGDSQYATLHLRDSYFRLVYGPQSEWGTSIILLPSFWSGGKLYQGAPVTATWQIVEPNLLAAITGTIGNLKTSIHMTLTPPLTNSITAHVETHIISGTVSLDQRVGEAFKPVMLSSMHISPEQWDAETVRVSSLKFPLPQERWILTPTLTSKIFGLLGGTSKNWKTNAPTFIVELEQPLQITGWVTFSTDPNNDNIGLWAATDTILRRWIYTISASQRIWDIYFPVIIKQPTPTPTPIPTPTSTPIPAPTPSPTPWIYKRDAESPSASNIGKKILRENACQKLVHGQFGTEDSSNFPAKPGFVTYSDISIPQTSNLYLRIRYSKNSPPDVPIDILVDDNLRASFTPSNQANWNSFVCTEAINLGSLTGNKHKLTFHTEGQQFGVADLDKFALSNQPDLWVSCTCK